jgi:predicted nucleic acid-binding Zn ribbon protein
VVACGRAVIAAMHDARESEPCADVYAVHRDPAPLGDVIGVIAVRAVGPRMGAVHAHAIVLTARSHAAMLADLAVDDERAVEAVRGVTDDDRGGHVAQLIRYALCASCNPAPPDAPTLLARSTAMGALVGAWRGVVAPGAPVTLPWPAAAVEASPSRVTHHAAAGLVRVCVVCGATIGHRRRDARTCGATCRMRASRRRRRAPRTMPTVPTATCPTCGTRVPPATRSR